MPGFEGETRFDKVESVSGATERQDDIDLLLGRYVMARIQGRSVFGQGYYGWPVVAGLTALWLSVAAACWLARCAAASDGRISLSFEDVAHALGTVDRAASRIPSLATAAERGRLRYLLNDDGVARLLHHYAPTVRPERP